MNTDIRRLLIAYDFSRCADRALDLGLVVARQFSAKAAVINVINRRDIAAIEEAVNRSLLVADRVSTSSIVDDFTNERADRLKTHLATVRGGGPMPRVMIRVGDPVEEILHAARHLQIDLIVMGARGHSRLTRLLTGSKAETLFRLSPIPVLSVRDDPDH